MVQQDNIIFTVPGLNTSVGFKNTDLSLNELTSSYILQLDVDKHDFDNIFFINTSSTNDNPFTLFSASEAITGPIPHPGAVRVILILI